MAEIYDEESYAPKKGVGYLLHRVRSELLAAMDREFAADEQLADLQATSAQFALVRREICAVCRNSSAPGGAVCLLFAGFARRGVLSGLQSGLT